jgi:hypothetical protein
MAANEIYRTTLMSSANLKGYWRFEDTSGTTVTDSGSYSHPGTASRTQINGGAAGKFGYCGTFVAASTDKVTITDHADLKPTGAFSVGYWFKTSTADGVIFQSYSANTNLAGIVFDISSTKLRLIIGRNTGTTVTTDYKILGGTAVVNDGNWHFGVATWTTTVMNIYLDGSLDATVAYTSAPGYAASNYVITQMERTLHHILMDHWTMSFFLTEQPSH